MGNKYLITGVQLGMIKSLVLLDSVGNKKEISNIIDEIVEKQEFKLDKK